jgi:cardiolipin synthase
METFFLVLAVTAIASQLLVLILALFGPGLEYRIQDPPPAQLDSWEFARVLGNIADAEPHQGSRIEVLKNGDTFYEAELEAIASARSHVCLEAYIFQKGEIARRFIAALAERARDGVRVMLVLDAVGSLLTTRHTLRELIAAGGEVHWYIPFRWYNVTRYNHRTHRELLVVDGRIGFIGGAGVADHWYKSRGRRKRRWRDTMFRVEGPAVSSLQAIFAENWLEASGELLVSERYYREWHEPEPKSNVATMVINSTPTYGRGTRARMTFQTLIDAAARTIHITTPYFLPNRSVRSALIDAVQKRGVDLKIIVPGKHADHLLTRRSSRRLYGELLRNGAQIYEYQPSMIHTKSLVVDGIWSVVGSANFDRRSFSINDEVNLAALDEALALRMEQDFQADLAESCRITYKDWRRRPVYERVNEWLGWILEGQE